ncbi:hypothetical protein Gotur_008155 [Gossypium turneri]
MHQLNYKNQIKNILTHDSKYTIVFVSTKLR